MAFKFSWIADLLQRLDALRHKKNIKGTNAAKTPHSIVSDWFREHNHHIPRHGPAAIAFLSCLFPERLTERGYGLKEERCSNVFSRSLGLGSTRAGQLKGWKRGEGDFPTCLERVMAGCENPDTSNPVTIDEIDHVLFQIAANSGFSAPKVRRLANKRRADDIIRTVILRLKSWEAKWFARLIFKSFHPVEIPEQSVLECYHFLLSAILPLQNSFEAAIEILGQPEILDLPYDPPQDQRIHFKRLLGKYFVPAMGRMIRRQDMYKARSIKHCFQMAKRGVMSVERKYDGEYCQVHIDATKGSSGIQIFSKSGKDSTRDRLYVHNAIKTGLQLGNIECNIERNCIIEGELLVWDVVKGTIEPIDRIRNHVLRNGRQVGAVADSPKRYSENLMIVFYDLLFLDDRPLINEPLLERRRLLEYIVSPAEGFCHLGDRKVINLALRHGLTELRNYFASAITRRWEGLVLKDVRSPYFSWEEKSNAIKLKKDYINGLGECADLCIIGGAFREVASEELRAEMRTKYGLSRISWTEFYLACLENKDEVRRHRVKPAFRIVDVLGLHSISTGNMAYLNHQGSFRAIPFAASTNHLDVQTADTRLPNPTHLFKQPFVVEIMGAGFYKPSDTAFWVLRFPRTVQMKMHDDRDITETHSFGELQTMARNSMIMEPDLEVQEEAAWIQRLICADGRVDHRDELSPETTPTKTISPKTPERRQAVTHVAVERSAVDGHSLSGSPSELRVTNTVEINQQKSSQMQCTGTDIPLKRKASQTALERALDTPSRRQRRNPPDATSSNVLLAQRQSTKASQALHGTPVVSSAPNATVSADKVGVSPRRPSSSTGSNSSRHRSRPLSEISNFSSQHVSARPYKSQGSDHFVSDEDIENSSQPPLNAPFGSCSPANKLAKHMHSAGRLADISSLEVALVSTKDQPRVFTSLEKTSAKLLVVKEIVTSHLPEWNHVRRAEGHFKAVPCLTTILQIVDSSKPQELARALKDIGRRVLIARMGGSQNPRPRIPPTCNYKLREVERKIVFFINQSVTSALARDEELDFANKHHRQLAKKYWLACLLFEFPYPFFCPKIVPGNFFDRYEHDPVQAEQLRQEDMIKDQHAGHPRDLDVVMRLSQADDADKGTADPLTKHLSKVRELVKPPSTTGEVEPTETETVQDDWKTMKRPEPRARVLWSWNEAIDLYLQIHGQCGHDI